MEVAAYRFGRRMTWTRVAREYETVFHGAVHAGRLKVRRPRFIRGADLLTLGRAIQGSGLVNAAE